MPYQAGHRLPAERASRLGHLDVLKSKLVNKLVESFENRQDAVPTDDPAVWGPFENQAKKLELIFGVDGSLQPIQDDFPPYKALAFVKTALLRLDHIALQRLDRNSPNPFALRDVLTDSALYHATVFPLRNVTITETTNYDAIRNIIYESIKDPSLEGEPFATLKWLAYEKWDGVSKSLPLFECPHCEETKATLVYDADEGTCPNCNGHLLLTDMLGFHQVMTLDSAPDGVASDYMNIHETLLIFSAIRHFWETKPALLESCLFVKDGPLSIRAQYSKLVAPIRRFFQFSKSKNIDIHLLGQEKSGPFFDHFELIGKLAPNNSFFIPSNKYIREKIQQKPERGAPYGKDTNYGAKIFIKLDSYTKLVVTIPTGSYVENPQFNNLIGGQRIFATLPTILSHQFEGGLIPVQLAHGIASLSSYPSAKILSIFSHKH